MKHVISTNPPRMGSVQARGPDLACLAPTRHQLGAAPVAVGAIHIAAAVPSIPDTPTKPPAADGLSGTREGGGAGSTEKQTKKTSEVHRPQFSQRAEQVRTHKRAPTDPPPPFP
jgi:hypothetical protein